MLTYHEYEKTVYDWLMTKREQNPNFTFSLRKKVGKGQEKDIFIGTEKSKYFATTFWSLRIDYPGSSGEAIGIIFKLGKIGYSYFIELNQTNKPHNEQNEAVLRALKKIFSKLPPNIKYTGSTSEANAMFNVKISPIKPTYDNLEFMFNDIDKQLAIIEPLVDEVLMEEKLANPEFIGQRITNEEFDFWINKLNTRADNEQDLLMSLLNKLGETTTNKYFDLLKRLIADLNLDFSSQKVYFNYEKDKLIFGIGQRYALNVSTTGFFTLISKHETPNHIEEFKTESKAYLTNYPVNVAIEPYYNELLLAANEILATINKSGYYKFDKKDFRSMAFEDYQPVIFVKQKIQEKPTMPLNQILYGPPGTGKTYHTINKALQIINDEEVKSVDWSNRTAVKALYQKKVEAGQIVFTTFHQSMSYEDFVEGIKPLVEEDENGNSQVVYKVESGVFKRFVEEAKKLKEIQNELIYHFDEAWDELVRETENHIENNSKFSLPISTGNKTINVLQVTSNGNLLLKPKNGGERDYTVSYSRAKKLQEAFPDLSVVKNIDKEFRAVIGGSNSTAYWAVLNDINKKIANHQPKKQSIISAVKPHILIIDEINRGNVSAIFGELITLIEESKRTGNEEALEVILPYSKDKFSVPANLYIIGTMNTADRSVEALDTALRRRFVFEEMMPKLALLSPQQMLLRLWKKHWSVNWDDENWIVEEKALCELLRIKPLSSLDTSIKTKLDKITSAEINASTFDDFIDEDCLNIQNILNIINQRIELLLDRDHQIGHSYFINIQSKADLVAVFNNNIVPLLQEYFYGDYAKIGLVLGKGFFEQPVNNASFASFYDNYENEFEPKQPLHLKKLSIYNLDDALAQLV